MCSVFVCATPSVMAGYAPKPSAVDPVTPRRLAMSTTEAGVTPSGSVTSRAYPVFDETHVAPSIVRVP